MRNTKTGQIILRMERHLYQYSPSDERTGTGNPVNVFKSSRAEQRCITIATSTMPAQYILPDIQGEIREEISAEQFSNRESDSSTALNRCIASG